MYGRKHPLVGWSHLIPGLGDLVFATVLEFVRIGGRHTLCNDPGTLRQLRPGRDSTA